MHAAPKIPFTMNPYLHTCMHVCMYLCPSGDAAPSNNSSGGYKQQKKQQRQQKLRLLLTTTSSIACNRYTDTASSPNMSFCMHCMQRVAVPVARVSLVPACTVGLLLLLLVGLRRS